MTKIMSHCKNFKTLYITLAVQVEDTADCQDVLEDLSKTSNEGVDLSEITKVEKDIDEINAAFGPQHLTLQDCITHLESMDTDFSKTCLKAFSRASPISMMVTFEMINQGLDKNMGDCLKMEFNLSQHFMSKAGEKGDFYEGIRALLVDKDNKPVWSHKSIKDVSPVEVSSYFEVVEGGSPWVPN